MDERELPVWRSLLFVPANVRRFAEKAPSCGADGIIVDLEDSIAPAQKDAARAMLPDAVKLCAARGADILVRINRPLELAVRDIEAAVCPEVAALMLPKTESADHVRLLAEVVQACEVRRGMRIGHTRFYAVVETVSAFPRMFRIAAAHPRIVAFTCGTEDLAASMGTEPDPDVLRYPKQQGILAARAAGVLAMGLLGSSADFRDLEGYRHTVRESRRFGIDGASCIHPSQVPVLNDGLSPDEREVAGARRIVEAFDAALAAGRGAIALDGKMLDEPVVQRARRVLRVAGRHAAAAHGHDAPS